MRFAALTTPYAGFVAWRCGPAAIGLAVVRFAALTTPYAGFVAWLCGPAAFGLAVVRFAALTTPYAGFAGLVVWRRGPVCSQWQGGDCAGGVGRGHDGEQFDPPAADLGEFGAGVALIDQQHRV